MYLRMIKAYISKSEYKQELLGLHFKHIQQQMKKAASMKYCNKHDNILSFQMSAFDGEAWTDSESEDDVDSDMYYEQDSDEGGYPWFLW